MSQVINARFISTEPPTEYLVRSLQRLPPYGRVILVKSKQLTDQGMPLEWESAKVIGIRPGVSDGKPVYELEKYHNDF